jgi:outer membrane protein assembly factor BamA
VHFDLRDDLIRPTLSALIDIEADYSHGIGDDVSSYFRLRGSADFSISLWRGHGHVLVLHASTMMVAPMADNGVVPFSELAVLGGPETLRGFRVNQFRDFTSLLTSAEYRWPIMLWLDAALFVDWGGVFGKWYDGFGASRMQPDVGFGFRLRSRDRFYVKLQLAYGFDSGWQIYVTGQNLP